MTAAKSFDTLVSLLSIFVLLLPLSSHFEVNFGTLHRSGVHNFGIQDKVFFKIKNRFYMDKQGCSQTKREAV